MSISKVAALAMVAFSMPATVHAGLFSDILRAMPDLEAAPPPAMRYQPPRSPYVEVAPAPAFGYPDAPYDDGRAATPVRRARSDPRQTTDVLHDVTLERGDAVMTAKGFLVFVGDPEADPHSRADFVAPQSARDVLAKRDERVLAALEPARIAAREASAREAYTGRSAVTVTPVTQGVPVVDPKGRTVRYLGP